MHSSKCLWDWIHLLKCSLQQNVSNFYVINPREKLTARVAKFTLSIMYHSQAFMTRSPRTSGFQSSQEVSNPSAKRIQKFLKWPLLTRDSEEQAVISVLSIVRTRAEPVSKSMVWLAWQWAGKGVSQASSEGEIHVKRSHFQGFRKSRVSW